MIRLTALEPEDLELLYTIENDVEMWSVSSINVPYSRFSIREYLLGQKNDIYSDKQLRLVIREEDKAVGLIDMFDFSPENRRAEMGLAILKNERGKGYAEEAIRLLQEYCKETLALRQLYCIVPSDNKASMAMLKRTGFEETATLRDWLYSSKGWREAKMLTYMF